MVNDVSIIAGIITVFVLLGTMLPFINAEFNTTSTATDISGYKDSLAQDVGSAEDVTMFTVIKSILLMFFWTFGQLPFWLDSIFVIFRLLLAFIIARNIWIGGGG